MVASEKKIIDYVKKTEFISFVLKALVPITLAVGIFNFMEGFILSGAVDIVSSILAIILYFHAQKTSNFYLVSNGTAFLALIIFTLSAYEKMDNITFMVWLPLYAVFYFMITNIKWGFIWTGLTFVIYLGIYLLEYLPLITFTNYLISSLALLSTVPLVYFYEKNNINHIKELNELASIDPLTFLLNRRSFFNILNSEIASAKRHNNDLYLFILDIDFFKSINDEFGHNQGDLVMQEVSEVLSRNIRKEDYLGRYGGEEFILLITIANQSGVTNLAKKLNSEIRTIKNPKQISISIGISNKADNAMYEVKKSGRDSYQFYWNSGNETTKITA